MNMQIVPSIATGVMALLLVAPTGTACGQDPQGAQPGQELQQPLDQQPQPADQGEVETKASEVGVRFTPRMAQAMSNLFVEQMKGRYELSDEQANAVKGIVATRLLKTVSENAEAGRNAIEVWMESAMENHGQFSKESAEEFARQVKPLVPAFREFFVQTAGEIGKQMNVKQKLKFSADVAVATAGFAVFENRMAKWEEGKVGENPNLFQDSDDENSTAQPVDPKETPEHRDARKSAENQIRWEYDVESRWPAYVDQAIEYYEFDEAQSNSARGILKDVLERSKALKTPEWRKAVMENRIAQNMIWQVGKGQFGQGPVMFKLESQRDQLAKPLLDLSKELKNRIEDLPTSGQRAKAAEKARKAFAEKGVERIPL